jgi:hypothetical protein
MSTTALVHIGVAACALAFAVALSMYTTSKISIVPAEDLHSDKTVEERTELAVALERWHVEQDLRDRWWRFLWPAIGSVLAALFYYFVVLKNIEFTHLDAFLAKWVLVAFFVPIHFLYVDWSKERATKDFNEQKFATDFAATFATRELGIGVRGDRRSVAREVAASVFSPNPFPWWYRCAAILLIFSPFASLLYSAISSSAAMPMADNESTHFQLWEFLSPLIFVVSLVLIFRLPLTIQVRREIGRRMARRKLRQRTVHPVS